MLPCVVPAQPPPPRSFSTPDTACRPRRSRQTDCPSARSTRSIRRRIVTSAPSCGERDDFPDSEITRSERWTIRCRPPRRRSGIGPRARRRHPSPTQPASRRRPRCHEPSPAATSDARVPRSSLRCRRRRPRPRVVFMLAAVAGPPSPLNRSSPDAATVAMTRCRGPLRMRWLARSRCTVPRRVTATSFGMITCATTGSAVARGAGVPLRGEGLDHPVAGRHFPHAVVLGRYVEVARRPRRRFRPFKVAAGRAAVSPNPARRPRHRRDPSGSRAFFTDAVVAAAAMRDGRRRRPPRERELSRAPLWPGRRRRRTPARRPPPPS